MKAAETTGSWLKESDDKFSGRTVHGYGELNRKEGKGLAGRSGWALWGS